MMRLHFDFCEEAFQVFIYLAVITQLRPHLSVFMRGATSPTTQVLITQS